jgi:hypothetical protein
MTWQGVAVLCAALVILPEALHAMDLRVAGNQIVLQGSVEKGDYQRVQTALDTNRAVDTVVLKDSPGGDALTGYALGELFRERGIRTAVSGYCRSSCSRLFLGGTSRHVTDE